jgi:hypothetical protein
MLYKWSKGRDTCQSLNGSPYYLARSLSKRQGSPKGGECANKKKTSFIHCPRPTNPSPSSPPLKIHKLTHVLKWWSTNLKVFATIVMRNIFLGINVRRKNYLWPFKGHFRG